MSTTSLFLSIFFGSVGLGLAVFGKRQKMYAPFFCGLALIAMPYFLDRELALIAAGIVLMAIPYFVRR